MAAQLDAAGYTVLPGLLSPSGCEALAQLYREDGHFRSRVVMGRHGFGQGSNGQGSDPPSPGSDPATVASAPELDPATLGAAVTLLLGSLAVLRSRRARAAR